MNKILLVIFISFSIASVAYCQEQPLQLTIKSDKGGKPQEVRPEQISAKERYAEVLKKARSLYPDARLVEVKNYRFPGNLTGFDLDGKLIENWVYTFTHGNKSPLDPDFSQYAFHIEANSKNVFLKEEDPGYKIPYRPIPDERWIIDSDVAINKANEAGGKEWLEKYREKQYKEISYTLQYYDIEYFKSLAPGERVGGNLLIWEISYFPEGDFPPDIKKALPAYIIGVDATTGDIHYKSYGAPVSK